MPTQAPRHPSPSSTNSSTTLFEPYPWGPEGEQLRKIQDDVRKSYEARAETTSQDSRIAGLRRYLAQVSSYEEEAPLISEATAASSLAAWKALWSASGKRLSVPDACPGPDGQLLYTWDREEHHLELEIFPSGRGEFFYRNRKSGELWDWDLEYIVEDFIPPVTALSKLLLFM